jgi:predicted ATP-binding protein involved in virulence
VIIQSLELLNFRRFEKLAISFDPSLTVIVARNGQGKTSVLDAITIALGTFVGAFDLGKAHHIEKSDPRLSKSLQSPEGEAQFPVAVTARFDGPACFVRRELTGPKNKTTIRDANEITAYGSTLQEGIRTREDFPLPIISYYGAGRLWKVHKNMERKKVVSASRTMGYEDCLSPASNFVQCQQWMAKATLAHLQEQSSPEGTRPAVGMGERLAAIQDAVNFVLAEEGWGDFQYSFTHEELTMINPYSGRLPVSLLSDGVRAMVSMVADIAFRCVRLNGYLGRKATSETQGIVLIDEVDIHLHPAWQQRVIRTLRAAFPRIQFIVTTHSPQVLSCVDAKCIRLVAEDIDSESCKIVSVAQEFSEQTLGVDSSLLLSKIMGVDPVPDTIQTRWLSEYHMLIQQDQFESVEGRDLRRQLIEHFGESHPVMRDCDRLIRLQSYKSRIPVGFGGN